MDNFYDNFSDSSRKKPNAQNTMGGIITPDELQFRAYVARKIAAKDGKGASLKDLFDWMTAPKDAPSPFDSFAGVYTDLMKARAENDAGALDTIKAERPFISVLNEGQFTGEKAGPCVIDIDIDEKDTTPDQKAEARAAFGTSPHIIAFWPSRRGGGLHGLFVTLWECSDAAQAYIREFWPTCDPEHLAPSKPIMPLPGGTLKPSAEIWEGEGNKQAPPRDLIPSPSFEVTQDTKRKYWERVYTDICSGGHLDHEGMTREASKAGALMRECGCVSDGAISDTAQAILARCNRKGPSAETLKTVTDQIRWGIDKGTTQIEWKAPSKPLPPPLPSPSEYPIENGAGASDTGNGIPKAVTLDGLLNTPRTIERAELAGQEQTWLFHFYRFFAPFDDGDEIGFCRLGNGYLYTGTDYKRILKKPVFIVLGEGEGKKKARDRVLTVQDVIDDDQTFERRVDLRAVRNYKAAAPVTFERKNLQYGERAARIIVNDLPRLAPHDGEYGNEEKSLLRLALIQFMGCFDTPKEFVWALNCVCHKAAYGDMTRRSKCILFLFDDGLNGNGAGRGKTLFATLPRFLYGRDHVSLTRKKYGFRAEKDFDGDENLMLFNVCNEFRPVNQKGYMDELCAFCEGARFSYTEKGKKTIEADTVCQLILTANTASEMELSNRTKRRCAFVQFGKEWKDNTPGADAVYLMCGSHGDEWQSDDDPQAIRLRSCFWAFCRASMCEGGKLHAPVLDDVDKALGYTKGQDLAKQQKAQDDPLYQRIIATLEDLFTEQAGPISAKDLSRRLGESSQKIAKSIRDSNRGEIEEFGDGPKRFGKSYALKAPDWEGIDKGEAQAPTRWAFPTSFDDVCSAIDDILSQI